jgi:hypothetical protein
MTKSRSQMEMSKTRNEMMSRGDKMEIMDM